VTAVTEGDSQKVDVRSTADAGERRRVIELVIAAAVVAISLASLFTAVYQSIVMRRALEASVWPRLEWENSSYDPVRRVNAITFAIANRGVGPARIERVEILLDGARLSDRDALLIECCVDGATPEERAAALGMLKARGDVTIFTSTVDGAALTPGQKHLIVEFERPVEDGPALALWARMNEVRDTLDLTVCYCSVFDDCWTTRARGHAQVTEPVRRCPSEPEPGFAG
jgi:hypothetical protein